MWSSKSILFVNGLLKGKASHKLLSVYYRREFTIQSCLQLHKTDILAQNHLEPSGKTASTKKTAKQESHLNEGPDLEYFIANSANRKLGIKERLKARKTSSEDHPYLTEESLRGDGKLGK